MTRNETKIAEEKKQKQEMQAEAQSVFYLVSIVWGGCLEVSKIVGLQVYGYKQKLVLVLQSLQCEGFKGWQ